jgi:pimeloyl-ACP methyl ester carboxylesterase
LNVPAQTTLDVAGLPVHVVHVGQGGAQRPVLMLHGWGATVDLVLPLAEWLARLGYPVTALDLPGFGRTPEPPAAWTVHDYAHFVSRFMDASRFTGPVNLFGHSFGGRLGLILGAEAPERLHKLVLADSAGVKPAAPQSARARLNAYKALRDGLKRIGMRGLSERLRSAYNARYGSSDFNAAQGVMRQTFVNVVNEDLLPYAARVQRPTLLLWGDRDEDTPLSQGKALEAAIPDAGLVVLEGAGHYSYLDRLADAARIVDFFYRQGDGS